MLTYTYQIQIGDGENWWPERDDAHGTENWDGPADQLAGEILDNRVADWDHADGPVGYMRVLVWEGAEVAPLGVTPAGIAYAESDSREK